MLDASGLASDVLVWQHGFWRCLTNQNIERPHYHCRDETKCILLQGFFSEFTHLQTQYYVLLKTFTSFKYQHGTSEIAYVEAVKLFITIHTQHTQFRSLKLGTSVYICGGAPAREQSCRPCYHAGLLETRTHSLDLKLEIHNYWFMYERIQLCQSRPRRALASWSKSHIHQFSQEFMMTTSGHLIQKTTMRQ